MKSPRSPDVLLVVLDCVRARDFFGGEDAVPGLRATEALAREGTTFQRAVAPASWTFPSTASMFTGQYPWESGVYGLKKGIQLRPESTLADNLRARGFQTASFSANPLISPRTGLGRGFETSLWGSFSDCFLRKLTPRISAPRGPQPGPEPNRVESRFRESFQDAFMQTLRRYPLLPDVGTRLISRAFGIDPDTPSHVAPWIEPSLARWLTDARGERPVFCFVNLLDAHDPYIGLPSRIPDSAEWFEALRVSQQTRHLRGGPVRLDPEQANALHWLYRESIRVLDERLEAIFQIFRGARDWDNTCVVVTSDHGQAFGEEDGVFHTHGTPDVVHRIPLIVKPAGDLSLPDPNGGWTAVAHLPSIIASAAFGNGTSLLPHEPANGHAESHESASVALSLADVPDDGAVPLHDGRAEGPPEGPWVVGYWHEYKMAVDTQSLGARLFAVAHNGNDSEELRDRNDPSLIPLSEAVTRAASRMREAGRALLPRDVSSRLRSWGY